MNGLFGLLVVLYIVGSVVGAILKKARSGPIFTEPFPSGEPRVPKDRGEMNEEPPLPAEVAEFEEGEGLPETGGPILAEASEYESPEGVSMELLEHPESPLDDFTGQSAAERDEAVLGDDGWDVSEEIDEIEALERRGKAAAPTDASMEFPSTAKGWRDAVILAEILGPPLAKRNKR